MTDDAITGELRMFFEVYAQRFNDALDGYPDFEAIAAQYTSTFMAVGPGGVAAGTNDESFLAALPQGFDQYRAIGTKRMAVLEVAVTPIDELHAMAKVSYQASYVRPRDGKPIDLDFDVTYLLRREGEWQVFAFVAGDEQALYDEHDLRPVEA